MKKTALIMTAILVVLLTVAFAQGPQAAPAPGPGYGRMHRGGMPGTVDDRLARLTARYDLTDEQKQQIHPILRQSEEQANAIRQELLTADQRKAKMRELRQTTRSKIEAVLTPEQRAMQPFGSGGGKGRGMRMGGRMMLDPQKHMAWLDQRVSLTDEQKSKLTPVFEQEKQQAEAVLKDQSLTPQQRRERMREIHQATHQQVLAVLTPEQQQKMGPGPKFGQGPPQ
ncbi:MAG: Spy/CpxP family protein refolding chaperone [Terriglobales bacterium]